MKRSFIPVIISFLISVLFIYAALMKVMDYPQFIVDLRKSPLLANYNMSLMAPFVLGIELLAAILLNIDFTRVLGLYLSFFIMLSFTLYMGILYFFYTNIPCACGGILGKMSYPVHIGFNTLFTGIALCGVLLAKRYTTTPLHKGKTTF